MRTLVVHTGGIGDFLLACPAIAKLAETGPVELLGHPDRLALAVAGGIAEAAHSLDAVRFDSVFAEPAPVLLNFLHRFDRAVVWMRDPDGVIMSRFRGAGIRDVGTFPGLPPEGWTQHASRYYLHCLGVDHGAPFRLSVAPKTKHDVIIHPGSGGARKNWPLDNFRVVANRLAASGRRLEWLLGPAELESGLFEGLPALSFDSLIDTARALAGARLYLGNDSGITHLAAAVGISVVAIFGPTDPMVWAPLGGNVRVIARQPWPAVAEVLAACEAMVSSG